ncbi:NTP pyrophosphohydrolase [Streptomyces sp. NPDC051310]|uniref:NTP pyrophosphohydrolase n=1 Tax=Streptomyces sp. NPDC051310 TaxID=3365649 RepID=UPI003787BF8D
MTSARSVLVVVDAANVVGSVPDGWWRDRRAAAERLRDRLVAFAAAGVAGHAGPVEMVLVVEGRARGVEPVPGVGVVAAPGSGDDLVVELVREARDTAGRPCLVVTADRELRRRVAELGADCAGPSAVRGL